MEIKLSKNTLKKEIIIPPSKSVYHRALICAALSGDTVRITPFCNSDDILATINCLRSIGVQITQTNEGYTVSGGTYNKSAILDCNECGSTLRFMLPLCAALGINALFIGKDGLSKRPVSPLDKILSDNGVLVTQKSTEQSLPIEIAGKLEGNLFEIPGNISSQYISGMLFALSIIGRKTILKITGEIQSAPYIDITVNILKFFGFDIKKISDREYHIFGKKFSSPLYYNVEGDFSNGAFWLCAGAIAAKGSTLNCKGFDFTSPQGDKKIVDILRDFGAQLTINNDNVTVLSNELSATEIDASDIPDLVPILAVVASLSKGKTVFKNIERLRLKESDRVKSTVSMINSLGGNAESDNCNIYINGVEKLKGGIVNSFNDHRIAMSAAIASTICEDFVIIKDAQAVKKSYPDFFEKLDYYTKE